MVSENNKIGLIPAILMVAGNMMGSGVFMLPANLAGIGSIAIIGWLVTVVGAIALGLVFAKLTEISTAAGGPYAYARKAFGDYMGYQTNLVYWLANVIGNVGLAVAGLGYLTPFFPALRDPLVMALAQIAVIWFFTYANILGPKIVGRMQGVTTTIALFPIIGVALLGWFWFNPETYMQGWNVSGESSLSAIGMTLNFTLWAFIGVESASVSTAVVKNPTRNVPIATVVGHRAHPGEHPPRGLGPQAVHCRQVKGPLEGPPGEAGGHHRVVLGQLAGLHPALAGVGSPFPAEGGPGGAPGLPPGEGQLQFIVPPRGRVGVHRPLLGEEGEEGLLHGVLFPVAGEVEVHRRASRTKGLWARSTSRVEVPSWPGHTRRFPSRETSRFRDWRIWP